MIDRSSERSNWSQKRWTFSTLMTAPPMLLRI
jgi:hypothetical protein